MGLIFLIVLGAILGWLAAIILDLEGDLALAGNIGAGILGAFLAGLVVGPMMGQASLLADHYSVTALLVSLAGSITLIVFANLFRSLQLR